MYKRQSYGYGHTESLSRLKGPFAETSKFKEIKQVTVLHSTQTHTNSRCNKKQPLYRLKGHTTGSQVDTDDTDDRRERLGDLALPLATGTGGGLSQRRMWACQPHAPMSRRANVQEDAGQAQLVHARSTAHMDSTQRHGHTPRLPRPPRPRRESEAATCT